ncbi:hypothetical protein F2Q68_00027909 [Brassica cretica]|uniref:Late embryogenesis abundant protein LEA-2 subgroup domain-containing protein n=1 Tax=Brassica cretica TaxID=69181 RepID=A0A8S9IED9_BRACR|nr:hypothetical protein F2Q68_00027909 [Brassica cretica]
MLEIRFDEEDPSTPSIDIRSAHLKEIRFDVGTINSSMFITNQKMRLRLKLEPFSLAVFFRDTEIAREQVMSFTQGSRKVRLQRIQMISESVFLNVNQTEELKTQTMKDHVHLRLRTLIRVRVMLGAIHFPYRIRVSCNMEFVSPLSGGLIDRNCSTKYR